ncbi:MAG: hypothetical protein AAFY28_12470 [Actinomycetota bacterium]
MGAPDLLVAADACDHAVLPSQPFVSNRYHFGMLLGVADLETDQAYHRGKAWLHNAWLHGPGVIWGLEVSVHVAENEIRVARGLAIDGHGRELYVADAMCVDLGRWLEEQDTAGTTLQRDDAGRLVLRVDLCHDSCLERPVPSISEPCENSNFDTAYSRAVERGLPRLVVGHAEPERVRSPRLRQFFGQEPVGDTEVAEALTAVANADPAARARVCLLWFRRLAAADAIELRPADETSWLPLDGDGCIPLADLSLAVDRTGRLVDDDDRPTVVDNGVRPTHLATRTIQELLCHAHGGVAAPPEPDGTDDTDDTGDTDHTGDGDGAESADDDPAEVVLGAPQAVAESATIEGAAIELSFSAPLNDATVTASAFEVRVMHTDGWSPVDVVRAEVADDGLGVVLRLGSAPRNRPIRIVAAGAGPAPLLGASGRVLSGVVGEPVVHGGSDAALMITDDPSSEEE